MAPKTVVLDTAPLLTGVNLASLGVGRFVTVPEVLAEVRDSWARRSLQFASPFDIELRAPSEEAIKTVMAFARKTGDFASLSLTDLKVLALTFMLDKEAHGGKTDHLRMEPRRSAGSVSLLASGQALGGAAAARNAETKKESEGDVSGQKETDAAVVGSAENSVPTPSSHFTAPPDLSALEEAALEEQLAQEAANLDIGASDDEEAEDEGANDASAESDAVQLDAHSEKGDGVENDEQEKQETSSDDDGEDDDGGGWITPKNVARHKAKDMGVSGDAKKAEEDVLVAVITSDFAMQNVIMQMNLKLYSIDGIVIRRIKTFVLRCHACYKITSDMEKRFCPSCGNNTLMKTTCQLQDDGSLKIFLKKNFQYNNRGTRYTVPPPKGGKKAAQDLAFAEDDPNYQRKLREHKRMIKKVTKATVDPFSPEYVPSFLLGSGGSTTGGGGIGSLPRAIQLSGPQIGYGRANPNEVRKSTGNKKSRR